MKQILVDMDGVLTDIYAQFQQFEEQENGNKIPANEIMGKSELAAFPNGAKHVRSKGFFRGAPTIAGSIEGVKYLNDHHNVLIVSAATEFPISLHEKHAWLAEHYPFISWKQMIFCGEKKAITGDIMIDDHGKNLKFFDGERILFTQPHNMGIEEKSYTRVQSWDEIMAYFK